MSVRTLPKVEVAEQQMPDPVKVIPKGFNDTRDAVKTMHVPDLGKQHTDDVSHTSLLYRTRVQ